MHAESQTEFNGSEIGIELHGGASNLGGTFSLGLKYAAIINENFAVGPSFRLTQDFGIINLTESLQVRIFGVEVYGLMPDIKMHYLEVLNLN